MLSSKFNDNFSQWQDVEDKKIENIVNAIFTLNTVASLLEKKKIQIHHDTCLRIYQEIIADTTSSVYLATCAIDKPAHIILRRVLELGIAAVYLWDMPHISYEWQNHDHDLSFSDMLKHLNSSGFKDYVKQQSNENMIDEIINVKECQKIYGELSDIVHGKITSFESDLPNRFSFDENDWASYTELAERVLKIIIRASVSRHSIQSDVLEIFPKSYGVIN